MQVKNFLKLFVPRFVIEFVKNLILLYAWKKRDYSETILALTSLRNGQDSVGPLPKVKSVAVLNNLGCAYFKSQRNKKFLASQSFHDAKTLAASDAHLLAVVQANLDALDEMTNAQDRGY